ncbi:MAG: JAB domain-containing protein [bacterium]|nr:JAB domain-containing protein [bacterium]
MSDEIREPLSLLKWIPKEDRPRERLLRSGGESLSDTELVAVLLRVGRRGQSVIEMAAEVLYGCGGLSGLLDAQLKTLERRGLGRAKAATLLAAIELGRRLARTRIPERELLNRPELVANYLAMRYVGQDQEVMGALYLDVRNRLIADVDIYRGTLSRAAVEPRVILKEALQRSAAGFILFHTHPSGDPTPSTEDLAFTKRVAKAAEQVGVRMIDHLILGGSDRWVSLQRRSAW